VIDSAASRIEIHLFRAGMFGGVGDNHVILLTRFSGMASSSPAAPWTVRVAGEAASLRVVDPGTSVETRGKVQEKMLGPTQVDAAQYPTIGLVSRSLQPGDGDATWRLEADVTVHGVTRAIEFPLRWSEQSGRLRIQGQTSLRLTDFKIQPIRLGFGTVKVRNEFDLVYDVTLEPQP
jgi:polyisoprenoid-binding protein YceI